MFTIGDNLIVRVEGGEKVTPSGIVIAFSRDSELVAGEVEVVGPGKYFMDGNLVKGFVKVGDKVWFRRSAAIALDDTASLKRYVVSESALLTYESK